jgi:competence protein ComEA
VFKLVKDFFQLTHQEIKGITALLFTMLLIFLLPRVYFKYKKPETSDDKAFLAWANTIENTDKSLNTSESETYSKQEISTEFFNPNTATYQEMKALGIDGKTANILLKFREKGATFYTKKDLLKVYGFTEALYSSLENKIVFAEKGQNNAIKTQTKSISHFVFDPNKATLEDLIANGMSNKTAQGLINFRKKGFVFKQKEDLKKVYGIDQKLYEILADFVIITDAIQVEEVVTKTVKPAIVRIVDINTADTTELKTLKGIGSFYAKQIVKYREKLGGFNDVQQLKEIYRFDDEKYAAIENAISLGDKPIQKININTATFKELVNHPYILKDKTVDILNLKKEIGGFLKIEDLKSYHVLTNEEFDKLSPYISVK